MPWVTTFGPASKNTRNVSSQFNRTLKDSPIFEGINTSVLKPVFRKAQSLSNCLFKQKEICFKNSNGVENSGRPTVRCTELNSKRRGAKCKCCPMASNEFLYKINGRDLICEGGDCKSCLLIYLITCNECGINYFGKTINDFRSRLNGHRTHMNGIKYIKDIDEKNCLAAHAHFIHGAMNTNDFNKLFKFSIVKTFHDPTLLLTSEQKFINDYRTQFPLGLNSNNPIAIKPWLKYK